MATVFYLLEKSCVLAMKKTFLGEKWYFGGENVLFWGEKWDFGVKMSHFGKKSGILWETPHSGGEKVASWGENGIYFGEKSYFREKTSNLGRENVIFWG